MSITQKRKELWKPYSLPYFYKLCKAGGDIDAIKNKRREGLAQIRLELENRDRIRDKGQLLKFIGVIMELESYSTCEYILMDLMRCEVVKPIGTGYRYNW